jgi:glucose/arabinose dehydrogenase
VASALLACACAAESSPATTPSPTAPPTAGPATSIAPTSSGPGTTVALPTTVVPLGDPTATLVPVASVTAPIDLAVRPGDATLYVADQRGLVFPVRAGVVGAPVLDITDRTAADGERGLLGLAFHPTEPFAYVDYTDRGGDTVVAEYAVDADGTFRSDTRRVVLTIDQPYPNHNGGEVVFGPDGLLYVGTGDGGSAGDPERRSLDTAELLGKILRIDPRPDPTSGAPYRIPADNPFAGVSGARPEIWAIGVRNPWRMSFDRATGDLWFGDVGQNAWEEIDVAWAADGGGRGANFGWSAWEGSHRYNDDQSPDGVTMPIHEYPHGDLGCSVSGGVRYRGAAIPELVGWFVYSDYCSGQVRALQIVDRSATREVVLAATATVSAVTEGDDGELYVLSLSEGVLALRPRG